MSLRFLGPWNEEKTVKKSDTGTETIDTTQTEEKNHVRILHVSVVDETSAVDGISFGVYNKIAIHYLKKNEPAGANESVDWDGVAWLRPLQTLRTEITGGAASDFLRVYLTGELWTED